MTDKCNIEKFRAIEEDKYSSIDLDHLVMYAIGELEKVGADLSFENAVAATFRFFPKKFSLIGFPEYPDGKRIHDCLFHCTHDKQWLAGKTRQGFSITERSRAIIHEAGNLLLGKSVKTRRVQRSRRRKDMVVAELESSEAYAKYLKGNATAITEADLCFMLGGTLDSSRNLLRANLEQLQTFAKEQGREDVWSFLGTMGQRFKAFLSGS